MVFEASTPIFLLLSRRSVLAISKRRCGSNQISPLVDFEYNPNDGVAVAMLSIRRPTSPRDRGVMLTPHLKTPSTLAIECHDAQCHC